MNKRVTFRAPKELLNRVDRLVEEGVYQNRSEAFREGVRMVLDEREEKITA